jgi:hypothetical protein
MEVIFWNSNAVGQKDRRQMFSRYVGPYKIAYWMRKHNVDCQVIDFIAEFTEQQLYAATKKFMTDKTLVLAISTTFLCADRYVWSDGVTRMIPESVINIIKTLKSEYPQLRVVIGGYASDRLSGWGVVDATVMSYVSASEDIFLEYVNHLKTGSEPPLGRLELPVLRDGMENTRMRMIYDQARNPTYNIELDDFKFSKQDVILPGELLPLDVSRGCIFACRFCQYPHLGKKKLDYIRGMNYLEDEIRHNYEQFGTTNYFMLDDTFNDTVEKMTAWHQMVNRLPFKISYSAYLRADLIHRFPDTAHLLSESGLFGAIHGLESMHPYASNLIGKGWSGKHAREYIPKLFHDIWKSSVAQQLGYIVGLPRETRQDLLDTYQWFVDNRLHHTSLNFLQLFGPDSKTTRFSILSEFDRNAEKYGFTFDENGRWRNETWTQLEARDFKEELRTRYMPHNRVNSWTGQVLLSYGYDREYLLRTPTSEIDWTEVFKRDTSRYTDYYSLLMSL